MTFLIPDDYDDTAYYTKPRWFLFWPGPVIIHVLPGFQRHEQPCQGGGKSSSLLSETDGYLLLGHYLRNHDFSLRKTLGLGIPMFLAGYLITFFGFRHISTMPEYTPEQLELFFYYCSPNVAMMTIPVFLICKHIRIGSAGIRALLANLTACGFGIYMIHYFFTGPGVIFARWCGVPVPMQIPFAAIVAFGISWIIVAAAKRYMGKISSVIFG